MSITTPRSWHEELAERNRRIHDAEHDDALALEVTGLRRRNAEFAAALAQARGGIEVRDAMLRDLAARLNSIDDDHAAAADRANDAERALADVLRSRRWRAGGAISTVARAPLVAVRRYGRR